jgi:hypothetical protein
MSEQTADYVCVPLCGADRAYGQSVKWWHHSTLCPAKEAQRQAAQNDGLGPSAVGSMIQPLGEDVRTQNDGSGASPEREES